VRALQPVTTSRLPQATALPRPKMAVKTTSTPLPHNRTYRFLGVIWPVWLPCSGWIGWWPPWRHGHVLTHTRQATPSHTPQAGS
jgi:hypothetical protein